MDTSGFIERFKRLLDDNNLSASALADEIDVQRSSISHILSGRNKPSLDFILKVLKRFPDINIYWLLNGTERKNQNQIKSDNSAVVVENETESDVLHSALADSSSKKIKHIVIFYEDATFERYTPS
ncbi:MAG: helix-turn-helix transcriptional regulator [Bacteroidota bacterium]